MTDRITFDLAPDGTELDTIDEIVLTDRTIHLEMLSHTSAYMTAYPGLYAEEDRFDIWASPVSRKERARRLKAEQNRLIDHLGCLLPWRWNPKHPRWCGWSVPVHRRPAAAVRDWWAARRYAGVALTVREEQ